MTTTTVAIRPSRPVAIGLVLALLSVLFGFGLGGAFGANEDAIKGQLESSGTAVLDSVYKGDVAAKDAVVGKSWSYLKRAHLHGGSIGAVALACIALLLLVTTGGLLVDVTAVALGAGGLFYSLFWMAAGFAAPGLGGTGAAKDAYEFIAIPGAGLSILGVVGTIVLVVKNAFLRK
jgi:hypothetical protein